MKRARITNTGKPIGLSDAQLQIVMLAAKSLPTTMRHVFLQRVASSVQLFSSSDDIITDTALNSAINAALHRVLEDVE